MNVERLGFLAGDIQMSARIDGSEVCWILKDAPAAIQAIAASGGVILGLDAREYDSDEIFEWPVSSRNPGGADDEADLAAQAALSALSRIAIATSWVLITWR